MKFSDHERQQAFAKVEQALRAAYHYAQSPQSYSHDELQFVFQQIEDGRETLRNLKHEDK